MKTTTAHIVPTRTKTTVRVTANNGHPPNNNPRTSITHEQHPVKATPTNTPLAPPTQICSGDNYEKCVKNQAAKPAFGGAVVYIVFGIYGIKRTFSPSHVIPQDDNLVSEYYVP